jgi:hypothetical protein
MCHAVHDRDQMEKQSVRSYDEYQRRERDDVHHRDDAEQHTDFEEVASIPGRQQTTNTGLHESAFRACSRPHLLT